MVDFAEGQKVEDNQIGQTFDHILNRESEGEG